MTYAPFIVGGSLMITGDDEDITDYIIEHDFFEHSSKTDDNLRDINSIIMYSSGLFTDEKIKRSVIGFSSVKLSGLSTTILNNTIDKKTPDGTKEWAIGSNHGIEPFAASIITYKNLKSTNMNNYLKFGIISSNYLIGSYISLGRVSQSGHSFGDQLINASIGNFLGVFVHDLLMVEDDLLIDFDISKDFYSINLNFKF